MYNRIVYLILLLVALIIYSRQRMGLPLPVFINNYVNDLLCFPLLLGAMTFGIRFLKKDTSFAFPAGFIVLLASYYSFYFEFYLPKVNTRYTSDWIDVFLYFIGGLVYYYFMKKKIN